LLKDVKTQSRCTVLRVQYYHGTIQKIVTSDYLASNGLRTRTVRAGTFSIL
jgi:hypothetical protein